MFTQVYTNQFVDRPFIYEREYTFRDPLRNYQQIGFNYVSSTKQLINSVLGGEHRTGNNNETRIDWNISTTFNTSKNPDTRSFIFGTDSTKRFVGINDNASGIASILRQSARTWNKLNDVVYSGGFNITTPFILFKQKNLFKTGFFFQNRTRENRASVIPYRTITGTIESALSIEDVVNENTTISLAAASLSEEGGDYNAGSSLFAVYESIENKIGEKLRIIWGLRLEKYQQSSNVFRPYYFSGFQQVEPVVYRFASRTDFNFLPSVNIIYSPVAPVNIRASISNTVIRPDLKDIIAIPTFDLVNFRLTQGNPELRITNIQNYDLKLEWFPSAGEIISVAAFYKKLTDPIEYLAPDPTALPFAGVTGVPINTGRAFVQGVEMELRKKIDFIKAVPWLKNISLFGNATLLKSKVYDQAIQSSIVKRIYEHTLTGQPKYIINAGFTIAALKNTLEFTLSFNKSGDYLGELGSFDRFPPQYILPSRDFTRASIPYYYVKARNLMDLVFSKSFYKNKAKIKLNITNLLSEPFVLYQDLNNNGRFDESLIILRGPNKIGNNLNVPNAGIYKSGTDNTATEINGQRTYSFTFSYTF